MFDLDRWQEIWQTMMKHRLRTGLTAFGVFWGIFMLALLLGAGQGLENGAKRNFDVARNALFVWTRETSVPFAGLEAGRVLQLTNEDTPALQALPEIEYLAPRLVVSSRFSDESQNIERGDKSVNYRITGDYPEYLHIKPYQFEKGRDILTLQ